MAEWKLETHLRDGTYLDTLPAYDIQGEFFYNKPDALRWSLPLKHPSLTYNTFWPGLTEVWLYRNGVLVFAGPCWNATPSSKEGKITCDAQSLESYFDLRAVGESALKITGQLGNTIWQLIDLTQNKTGGQLYITKGTVTTPSATFIIRKGEYTYISDIIDDLANAGDFDWNISPSRIFSCYYPKLQTDARVAFEYGGNISNYSVQYMGRWVANTIHFKKSSTSAASVPAVIDTASRTKYGLREMITSNSGLTTATQANSYLSTQLRAHKEIRQIPIVTIRSADANAFDGDITYGQLVKTVIDDNWVQINTTMRCTGFQVTIDKQGKETFNYYLSDLREVG